MYLKLLLLLSIIVCLSCVKDIDNIEWKEDKKLVIYPVARVNESIKIKFSETISYEDTSSNEFFNGIAILYENNAVADTIEIKDYNEGIFNVIAKEEKKYKIVCQIHDYPEVECNFHTTAIPVILSIDTVVNENNKLGFLIRIYDEEIEENYYKVSVYEKYYSSYKKSFDINKVYIESNSNNIIFYKWPIGRSFYLFEEPKGMVENTSLKKNGFALADELYFTNKIRSNNIIQISLLLNIVGNGILDNYTISQLKVEINSINNDQFKGLYSYARYNTNKRQDLPITEETLIYNAVKGGFGFALTSAAVIDSSVSSQKYKDFFVNN